MRVVLAVLALLVAGLAAPAQAQPYDVRVPDLDGPLPLVVFLHGCGADPHAYGLDAFADAKGFVVAYPRTEGCWTGSADEIAAVAALTRELQATLPVDRSRTYLAGHSAGSGLAALTAETHPDLYAAVGMVSGANATLRKPARPLPAYYVWGTDDRTTSYLTGRLQVLQWILGNQPATPLLPTSSRLVPAADGAPAFLVEQYRDRRTCADVEVASGLNMGHIPDFRWQQVFPALTDFLLAHRLGGCG